MLYFHARLQLTGVAGGKVSGRFIGTPIRRDRLAAPVAFDAFEQDAGVLGISYG